MITTFDKRLFSYIGQKSGVPTPDTLKNRRTAQLLRVPLVSDYNAAAMKNSGNRIVTVGCGALAALLWAGIARASGAPVRVEVSAGDFDRRDTPVEVAFENAPGTGPWELADGAAGSALPLQWIDARHALFILPELKAHQTRLYTLRPATPGPSRQGVEATREGGTVVVKIAGRHAFTYQGEKTPLPAGFAPAFQRGGYIYPVLTPSGKNVSDDYPPGHKHHHGIWSPWTKTEFQGRHPDFWNMGERTGTVEPVGFDGEFGGPVCAGFTARHRFVDLSARPEPVDALNETWQVVAYRSGANEKDPYFLFDLTITQTCATDSPLVLEKYRYGGLGFRGARGWDGKNNCIFLTSEGKNRETANQSRGRWCRMTGKVDGAEAGVAIFNRPDDFRFPQPMRTHPTEPFFCYAPEQLGEFRIVPGKPFVEHYRFVVSDGPADAGELDRLWNDYAHPPKAVVK